MPRRPPTRPRLLPALAALATAACLTALPACGPEGGATPLGTHPIHWHDNAVVLANNHPAPTNLDATTVCGSDTATFLRELKSTPIGQAKVMEEWADVVPGGTQVAVAGVVETSHLGPQDQPMSHELGDDLSLNVLLDSVFLPYTEHLGTHTGEQGTTMMHAEIASGFIPHVPRDASPDTGQTWAEMADHNLTGFQPGFDQPDVGDWALVQGRYIDDCAHDDYSTELHAMSFLAWARTSGQQTTVRAYYNPFRDTERYNADFSILGDSGDASRLDDAGTKPFPKYLIDEVLRVVTDITPRLRSFGLLDAEQVSPADWDVCAPAGTHGGRLQVRYDLVARSGVTVTVTPDTTPGCARVHTAIGDGYRPANVVLRHCELPWAFLNQVAAGAVGDPGLDVKQLIIDQVGQQNADKLAQDPEIACGDALAGPPVSETPTGQTIRVDDGQSFPFYGVITVAWAH